MELKKYPKIRYPGEDETQGLFEYGTVYLQEKLDGSNFRVGLRNEELVFGSRNTHGESLQREQFKQPIEYVESNIDQEAFKLAQEDYGLLTVFGEAMLPHTISYDWDITPEFVGFDVYSHEIDQFLDPDIAHTVFDALGLPFIEPYTELEVSEWEDYDFEVPGSEFYDGLAEGVMLKNPETGVYAKFVRDEFKERNKEVFGASSKKELSNAELLAEEYVPPARVRTVIHRLVEESDWGYEMSMMEDLPREVIRDMVEEEGHDLFMSTSSEVDLGEFRSVVSSRCASVLRQVIDRRAQEQLMNP